MSKKFFSIILCVSMIGLYAFGPFVHKANASYPVVDVGNIVQSTISAVTDVVMKVYTLAKDVAGIISSNMIVAYKIAALLTVQESVALIIGEGDGLIVRDYNQYLYTNPKQQALARMNVFFNAVSDGRLSSSTYEGVGPNYHAYLALQAKKSLVGDVKKTNLQEQVSDPNKLFSGGNMKGIMSYMQCTNNVGCMTLLSNSIYSQEFSKVQDLARSEQQNGFLPRKGSDGRIMSPSMMAQNALLDLDRFGTELIITADDGEDGEKLEAAIAQIAEGSLLSIVSRAANYGIPDNRASAAAQARNDQFPFSVDYNPEAGTGTLSSGGFSTSW